MTTWFITTFVITLLSGGALNNAIVNGFIAVFVFVLCSGAVFLTKAAFDL